MKIILTEKPSVSKMVRGALAPDARYIKEPKDALGYYEDSSLLITQTVGHIIEIESMEEINPKYKAWKLEDMPYELPDDLPTKVSDDKKDIFKFLQKCFSKYDYDEIIVATDGDREGQNIWEKIVAKLKIKGNPRVSRMWISEWTDDGIRDAFNKRSDNSRRHGLALAAKCREETDYLIGMELTRAMTAKYATGSRNVLAVGRVMTPTMKMVYDREKEILGFKKEPFSDVILTIGSDVPNASIDMRIKLPENTRLSKQQAEDIITQVRSRPSTVVQVVKAEKKTQCPKLFSLTSLSQQMNKIAGFSAKKTADIAQKLYQEYAVITYPGTNETQISEGAALQTCKMLSNILIMQNVAQWIISQGLKIADHCVTDKDLPHEAITPTYNKGRKAFEEMSADEQKVYTEVVKRVLAAFGGPMITDETDVTTTIDGNVFGAHGTVIKKQGWNGVLKTSNPAEMPAVTNGGTYPIEDVKRDDKETTPPARYTENTLLSAMKNAANYVDGKFAKDILKEVEGLGTARTRAPIIENIKHHGYFEMKEKTIMPTIKLMSLFDVIPTAKGSVPLATPSLTATIEGKLQEIENGQYERDRFMTAIRKMLAESISAIKADDRQNVEINSTAMVRADKQKFSSVEEMICPDCGKPLRENDKSIYCSDYKNCSFSIWKTVAGKKLPESALKALLTGKTTVNLKGFTSKAGKKFEARLKPEGHGKVSFVFGKHN